MKFRLYIFAFLFSCHAFADLFSPQTEESRRLRILNQFFQPNFSESLTLSQEFVSGYNHPFSLDKIYGFVKITPPKGICFTIRTQIHKNDVLICKTSQLKFFADEIDAKGRINWSVSTGSNDFGTDINWQTPYRIGKIVYYDMPWPGPAKNIIIRNCQAESKDITGRRIRVEVIGFHKPWVISFPNEDYLVDQPKPKPNLYYQIPSSKANFFKAEKGKKMKQGNASEEAEETIEEFIVPVRPNISASEARGLNSEKKTNINIFEQLKDQQMSNRKKVENVWQIHPRNTYTMNGSHFMSESSSPSGMLGRCRYNYSGFSSSLAEGVLECHDVEKFKWVLLPLPCLSSLQQKK